MQIKSRFKKWFPLLAALLLSCWSILVEAAEWSPHVGIDLVDWGVKPRFQNQQLFPRIDSAINGYIGTRINGCFGIDIGYEQSDLKEKSQVFTGGMQNYFNQVEADNDAATVDIRLKGFHVDINFYWEVVRRLELMFMLGVAQLYPVTHVMHLTSGTWLELENTSPPFYSGRFGFGVQFNPCPRFGIKGLVNWDQTLRIQYAGVNPHNVAYYFGPYQRATTFSLGVVYSFSNPRRGKHAYSAPDDYRSLEL